MDEKSAAITEVELTPGSAISVSDLKQDLTNLTPEYKGMLSHIEETLPATNAACDNFYKSHSQMMTVTLDITDLTPCLLYTSPSPRDGLLSRMPSSA